MAARVSHARRGAGFTYLGLIILVSIIGLVGAASLKVGALLQRAAAEEELLAAGAAFSDALQSYAAATPRGQPQQPPGLQDLLKDPRFPYPRRHLRKIFIDPVSGKAEWGIIYAGDQVGVLGVYSLSQARPLKVANFDARFLNFENKEHLSDWKFTATGQAALPPAILTASPRAALRTQPRPPPAPVAAPQEVAAPPADPAADGRAATEPGAPDQAQEPAEPPAPPEPSVTAPAGEPLVVAPRPRRPR
jgi:type II secretory pathway pseudopilin PulG